MSEIAEPNWQQVIAETERKDCSGYTYELQRQASAAAGPQAKQLQLLADVTSMELTTGARIEPLTASISSRGGRTAIPEDLTGAELDELTALLPQVHDGELSARLCDILWTRRRSHAHGRQAIEMYLIAAAGLEGSEAAWRARVERALAFASIMKDRDRGLQIVSYLKAKLEDEQPSRLTLSALELLLRTGGVESGDWVRRAEAYAQTAAKSGNILLERGFHACAALWHRKNKDPDAERRCRIAEAETYVAEADRASDAATALMMKAHFYHKAIEAFRQVGKCRERVNELHQRLVDVQERVAATMQDFEGPTIDLSDIALTVIEDLDGRAFPDALLRLATIVRLPSYDQTRNRAEELGKESPFVRIFGKQTVTAKGRVISKTPGGDSGDPQSNEKALLASMYEQHEANRGLYVTAMIEPARQKIWSDHGVSESDFIPLVTHNPLVPSGRERLFVRALYAGLTGDFIQATHVAIPQIEHAIRALLNRRGVITTGLDDDGLQHENSLGTLLEKPELAELIGQDRVFDMKSLLTEQQGANLRNLAAHGLMSQDEFFSVPAVYLWWLTLHLCFLPIIVKMPVGDGDDSAGPSGSD